MLREMIREGKGREVTKCQDCGNQAKKGCEFMRCRTCCNNKGFGCRTHINSTWVPNSRRRHLHPQFLTHSNNPSPGIEELNKLPAATSSAAVFRCVRVRSEDDTVDEYAYQTSVNIGGRVFSGVLYDQGPESLFSYNNCNVGAQTSFKAPLNMIHHQHGHHFMDTSMIQSHDVAHAVTSTVPPLMISQVSSAEQFSSSSSHPLSLGTFRPPVSYFSQPKT